MALPRTALAALLATALVACDTPVDTDGAVDCTIGGAEGRTLSMSVGDVATVSAPVELACLRLEASAAPSSYLFVPANVTPRVERVEKAIDMALRASESGAGANPAIAASVGVPIGGTLERLAALRDMRIDDRLRAFESTIDFAEVRAAWPTGREARRARGAAAAIAAAEPPPVGSTMTIRVPNLTDDTDDNQCDNPIAVSTTVKAVGEHAVILQDNEAPASGLSDIEFGEIATEFDELIFEVVTEYFGTPSDLDADQRIFILYTPEVNKLSTPGTGSYVGGFFFSGDLLEASRCPQSNESEIFYLLTADPAGEYGNEFETDLIRNSTRGTIAHEFQHMINIGVKIEAGVGSRETAWLNEGLSHFAEELVGRRALGRSDLDELTWLEVWTDESIFLGFFYQNFARFGSYLRNPQRSSATSDSAASLLSFRGASWAFVRHLADHHSDVQGSVAAFTRSLVLSPDTGIANLESRTGAPFEEQMRGWLIANWADDRGIANLDPTYEYASWRMREAMDCAVSQNPTTCEATYPLKVTSISAVPDGGTPFNLLTGTGAYFLGTWSTSTPDVIVQLTGPSGQLVSGTGGRMFVLRVD
jgi:hypothetical protein